MRTCLQITLLFGLAALQTLSANVSKTDPLQELLNHSPFGNPPANSQPTGPSNQPIEFRAVLEEHGKRIFSIYETTTHRSTWVELGRAQDGFKVETYDHTKQCVTVIYQGKTLSLPLTSAARKILPVQVAELPKAEIQEAAEFHDQPFRIGHVADELQIRRSVRDSMESSRNLVETPQAPAKR